MLKIINNIMNNVKHFHINGTECILDYSEIGYYEQNSAYIRAYTDNDGKLLWGIKTDGSIDWGKGVPYPIQEYIKEQIEKINFDENFNTIDTSINEIDTKLDSLNEFIHNILYNTEHNIYIQTIIDNDNKLLSARDINNNLYEDKIHSNSINSKNIETNNITINNDIILSEKSLNSIKNICKDLIKNDWSNSSYLKIDTPSCAIINVINPNGWPTTKTQNYKAELEFWDMNGNYFKKPMILNAQGSSSLEFDKKNAAFDLYVSYDDMINDEETFVVKFGDWVPQDSFHIKAYCSDIFKAYNPTVYKLHNDILKTRGIFKDRYWKKHFINENEISNKLTLFGNHIDEEYRFDDGARGFPDGFPCIAYLNGEFYGVYSWQLKKHRDNYKLNKSNPNHVHLDIYLTDANLFVDNINWANVEIRNPKKLIYKTPVSETIYEYDADISQREIVGDENATTYSNSTTYSKNSVVLYTIDNEDYYFISTIDNNTNTPTIDFDEDINTSEKPDFKNKLECGWLNCTNSVIVKNHIKKFSQYQSDIINAENIYKNSSKTENDLNTLKQVIEERFDVENIIDYNITIDMVAVIDSVTNNLQWYTYDGNIWYAGAYDLDRSFGTGGGYSSTTYHMSNAINPNSPLSKINVYYEDDLLERYKNLADLGILSKEHIFKYINDWYHAVGSDYYKMELEKWQYQGTAQSTINETYWQLVYDDENNPITGSSITYNSSLTYNVDDICYYGGSGNHAYAGIYQFKCIKTCTNEKPILKTNEEDSLYRVYKFIEKQVNNMDVLYSYNRS